MKTSSGSEGLNPYLTTSYQDGDYGKYEAKASPFRAGMRPTNSMQPPAMAETGFQRNL